MSSTLTEIGCKLESLPGERWKIVEGADCTYYASNMGRLLSRNWKGSGRDAIMKPALDQNGYYRTMLVINGRPRTIKVHRIVAQAWIPNPQAKPLINHINFNRSDNRIENLEWSTPRENAVHSYRSGRISKPVCTNFVKGSAVGTSKLTEEQVREIKRKFKPRVYTRKMLAQEYGVAPATIKDVILRSWRHVQ